MHSAPVQNIWMGSAIGERLKRARELAGFSTATDAAETFGWKAPTYLAHENGTRGTPLDKVRTYADRFRVDFNWLATGKGQPRGGVAPRGLEDGATPAYGAADHQGSGGSDVRKRTSATKEAGSLFEVDLPAAGTLPRDVPVLGVTVGGEGGDFAFNGQTVDHVRRPPGLANVPSAFALFVANDSMVPWKEPGELVYVEPNRPAKVGDYVVVELKATRDGEAGVCLVKRLKARSVSKLTLQQYNPPNDRIEIPVSKIRRVYRVKPLEELVGV